MSPLLWPVKFSKHFMAGGEVLRSLLNEANQRLIGQGFGSYLTSCDSQGKVWQGAARVCAAHRETDVLPGV